MCTLKPKMIIRENPSLIIKIKNNVYKFLPNEEIKKETDWTKIKNKLNKFNLKTKKTNLKIPEIYSTPFFTKTNYLGQDLFSLGKNIYELYDSISDFSRIHFNGKTTISLGDIQLRNVYKNNKFFVLSDLGIQAGEKVSLNYDRARFLVNLIDCNYLEEAKNIIQNENYKKSIILEMNKRCFKVFKKRLINLKVFSAIYRLLKFYKWKLI